MTITAFLFLCCGLLIAQARETGRDIYDANVRRVVVLYVRSTEGNFVALGSGFWVADRKIVTNAHVASRGGKVYVEVGDVRLACTLERSDEINDLALLAVDADVLVQPVVLAKEEPTPGQTVYVISNPEGLDKSISQGVVSGVRQINGRSLLQISAPISHGSSGGPVFNGSGEVVGIAVGMLGEGQNLNFAVPLTPLRRLLAAPSARPSADPAALLAEIRSIRADQEKLEYSTEEASPYQQAERKAADLTQLLLEHPDNSDVMLNLAKDDEWWHPDFAIAAAETVLARGPSGEAHLVIATAFSMKWVFEKADSTLLDRAERAGLAAIALTRRPTAEMYFRLGDIYEDKKSFANANKYFQLAAAMPPVDAEDRWPGAAVRGLMRVAATQGNVADEGMWFNRLLAMGGVDADDWRKHAQNLSQFGAWTGSGDAYRKAADLGGKYADWCAAANSYWIGSSADESDGALNAARQCLAKATLEKDADTQREMAHLIIADVLNGRGVYSDALSHAREAATLDVTDSWAYYQIARALNALRRFNEAVTAATEAIRLSDGKFSSMHFELGNAYFELQDYDRALQSFQQAARLNPKDPASAYNVALCDSRLGYTRDAANWYEEYLRRKPDAQDRSDILERIRLLRR